MWNGDQTFRCVRASRRRCISETTFCLTNVTTFVTTALVGGAGSVPSTNGAQYGYIPKTLHELAMTKNDRLRAQLRSPVHGGKTVVDIASELQKELPLNITDACAKQTAYLLGHLDSLWALQMLDALGKPPSGFLKGNALWMGDFDECIGVSPDTGNDTSFSGQYCLVSYSIQLSGRPITFEVGSCVPSGCSSNDTAALFNTVLKLLGIQNSTGFTAACHLSERPYDSGAYVTIVICSIFAALLLIGTGYDFGKTFVAFYNADSQYESLDCDHGSLNKSAGAASEKTCLLNGQQKHTTQSDEQAGTAEKLLLSFSVYSNGKKLLSTAQGDSTLGCINGIRFLSMCWVILGHTYVFSFAAARDPANFDFLLRRSYQVIYNASVSVDSFFILSGLLVTYLLLQQLDKVQGHLTGKDWGLIYLHRYIRLTPVYMIVLMIWTWLANHFYDGPLWPASGHFDETCATYWWTNLLYINNFAPASSLGLGGGCMGWSWYLANDMQFFLLTPPLAYLLYRKWYVGFGLTCLLVAGSVGAAVGVTVADSLTFESTSGSALYFDDYYIKPWCRFVTYGVGILLGYLLYKRKDKDPLPPFVVVIGWAVAAASCLAVIYGPYDAQFGSRAATATLGEAAANNSLSRLAWALGLSWTIFACSTSSGGWINTLLSWKPFIPLGRLTYCAYLIHPVLMTVAELATRVPISFDDISVTLRFLGLLVVSLALAFVTSLAFEAPVIGVERILIRSGARK